MLSEHVQVAFELLILTATRTSELLNAEWSEINLHAAVWSICRADESWSLSPGAIVEFSHGYSPARERACCGLKFVFPWPGPHQALIEYGVPNGAETDGSRHHSDYFGYLLGLGSGAHEFPARVLRRLPTSSRTRPRPLTDEATCSRRELSSWKNGRHTPVARFTEFGRGERRRARRGPSRRRCDLNFFRDPAGRGTPVTPFPITELGHRPWRTSSRFFESRVRERRSPQRPIALGDMPPSTMASGRLLDTGSSWAPGATAAPPR